MLRNQNAEQPAQTPSDQPPFGAPQATSRSRHGSRPRFFVFLLIFSGVFALLVHGLILHFGTHTTPAAAPIWRPLSAEPDGKIVYTGNDEKEALYEITQGKPASQTIISENDVDDRWALFKMAGHVYLTGYIAGPASLRSLQGHTLTVYNSGKLGGLLPDPTASKITLRVDKNDIGFDDDDLYSEVIVSNFQPDSFTTLDR